MTCRWQLDVRDPTPLLLSSRDEEMLLVATFGELGTYLEKVRMLCVSLL